MLKIMLKIGNLIKLNFLGSFKRKSYQTEQLKLESVLNENEKIIGKLEYFNSHTSKLLKRLELSKHEYRTNQNMTIQDLENIVRETLNELKSLNFNSSENPQNFSNVVSIKDHKLKASKLKF